MAEANLGIAGKAAIYPSLRDKRVIVSGGGSGIGAGLVEGFARQGAKVAFVDVAEDASRGVCQALAEADHAPIFRPCDITDTEAYTSTILDLVGEMGGCDVLLNNAANDDRHKIADVTSAYWDDRMAVNLKHQFFAAQTVVPAMKKAGGGSIVNLGSISWHLGLEDLTIYQTAKAAIEGLTRSLARELGRANIRVNTIVPGNVKTPRQEKWYTPEGEAEIVAAQCLDGRIHPVDIAAMALFLASDDARYCTAHNYWVDAGWR
ncbi:SDR family NAD(P)-dependent oxidoreductase [Aurantiacibacter spongiae]|uniref:SDR family oxidoreductase n=1 Tax=Aurantiacibacter spongiae TaxID=2488860 RepID=A0A3N5CWC0_9SPHN|nr:SDR family oxidoreductase [Aurantiacibacter spongiae]RPF70929.1 SDR family oxidoreductase [Aurantiacibacter spongiae]